MFKYQIKMRIKSIFHSQKEVHNIMEKETISRNVIIMDIKEMYDRIKIKYVKIILLLIGIFSLVTSILLQYENININYNDIININECEQLAIESSQGYTCNGKKYISITDAPQFYIQGTETAVTTILLQFNEVLPMGTCVQVYYYKEAEDEISEENSTIHVVDDGNEWIEMEIPQGQYEAFRLDIGNEEGVEFELEGIYCFNDKISFSDRIISGITSELILCLLGMFLLIFVVQLLVIMCGIYAKNNKKNCFVIIAGIISIILSIFLQLQINETNYEKILEKSEYVNGVIEGSDGYLVDGNEYTSIKSDPRIYVSSESEINTTLLLEFEEAPKEELNIEVYWAKSGEEYNQKNSVMVSSDGSSRWVEIDIFAEGYQEIRIDIGDKEGNTFLLVGTYFLDKQISPLTKFFTKIALAKSVLGAELFFIAIVLSWFALQFLIKIVTESNLIYKIQKGFEKNPFLFVCICSVVLCAIIYREFLTGERYFILTYDAKNQFFIEQFTLLEQFLSGTFPMWSFEKGFGGQITVGNPNWLGDPFALIGLMISGIIGEEVLPYTISVISVLKVILSTYLFQLYLKELDIKTKNNYEILIIFSILYAFNGHALVRGAWMHYMTEVVLVALWLLSLERYINKKNKLLFPICLALLFVSRNVAYVYVYSILTYAYLIIRIIVGSKSSLIKIIRGIQRFIPYYLLGLMLSSVMVLPGLYQLLTSARSGEDRLQLANQVLKLNAIEDISIAFTRSFSPCINPLSVISSYGINYLENPIPYVGIICMLLLPQLFVFKSGNKRLTCIFKCVIMLVIAYYLFKYPRLILTAFSSEAFKISSFWTNIALLMTSLYIYREVRIGRQILNVKILNITALAYGLIFILIYITDIIPIEFGPMILVVLFSLCYLMFFKHMASIKYGSMILITIVSVEVLVMSCLTYNSFYYENDDCAEYIINGSGEGEEVQTIDEKEDVFYRVTKSSITTYNEPQIENYNGTSVYTSINTQATIDFYNYFEIEKTNDNWLSGIYGYPRLESLTSVKYSISEEERDGFSLKSQIDDEWGIYENEYYLPLGFVYDEIIVDSDVEDYKGEIKQQIALEAIILSEEDYMDCITQNELLEYDITQYKIYSNNITKEKYLLYNLIYELNVNKFEMQLASEIDSNLLYNYLKFYESDTFNEEYVEAVLDRNKNTMSIQSFEDNYIVGTIDIEKAGLLFLSIPFDEGWTASVNGEEVDIIQANIGFSAIMLTEKENDIILEYETPYLRLGAVITSIGIVIWLGLVSISIYKKRKGKEE